MFHFELKVYKRKVKRLKEEILSNLKILKYAGIKDAFCVYMAKVRIHIINKYGKNETEKDILLLQKKHKILNEYIQYEMKEYINNYNFNKKMSNGKNYENVIWICWWQGIELAPDIVKKCVNSINKNIKNYNIIVIDEKNYKKYINIPKWLEEKKDNNIISKTFFSDIVRFKLLAEHGGIWLDATFYCTSNKIEEEFKNPLWTIRRPNYGHLSPACGNFANYSFGCSYDNRQLFSTISDFLIEYWKENNYIIDYLLTDYIINIILEKNVFFREQIDNIIPNNKNCDELFKVLGDKYDEDIWASLNNNTCLFKLSWKHEFSLTKNGENTFYGMILNGRIGEK